MPFEPLFNRSTAEWKQGLQIRRPDSSLHLQSALTQIGKRDGICGLQTRRQMPPNHTCQRFTHRCSPKQKWCRNTCDAILVFLFYINVKCYFRPNAFWLSP
jgi:hypothetical protein